MKFLKYIFVFFTIIVLVAAQLNTGSGMIIPGSSLPSLPSSGGVIPSSGTHSFAIPSSSVAVTAAGVASSAATAPSTLSTIAKAVEGVCTRTQCYTPNVNVGPLSNTFESAVSKIIVSETNKELSHMTNAINVRFSSYIGPTVAVAITAPSVMSKINNGDNIGAIGTVVDAAVKYKVGAVAFTTCTAYTVWMGPFAVIPGMGCSIISTLAIDGIYDKVGLNHKPSPKSHYREWCDNYDSNGNCKY